MLVRHCFPQKRWESTWSLSGWISRGRLRPAEDVPRVEEGNCGIKTGLWFWVSSLNVGSSSCLTGTDAFLVVWWEQKEWRFCTVVTQSKHSSKSSGEGRPCVCKDKEIKHYAKEQYIFWVMLFSWFGLLLKHLEYTQCCQWCKDVSSPSSCMNSACLLTVQTMT
jgi:hypothetical protein